MGKCMFGDDCFYQHTNPEPNETSLVKRVKNLKLVEKSLLTDDQPQAEPTNTPASYYEALTGKQLSPEQNLNDLDLTVFDPTYVDYLKLQQTNQTSTSLLCPYFENSLDCPFASTCQYIHGDICDVCNLACLHPLDSVQREQHRKECMNQVEKEMEEAFAIQRSNQKQCGICMEIVWDKEKVNDRRFGILENCNHCFCLVCIRQWRASKSYENKIVKACPECRVKSDYVTPSKYWFDNEEDKKRIINDYKINLGKTECKYYKSGDGTCPFGSKCFYLHRNKDGTIAQLPDPTRRRRFNRFGDSELYSNIINIDFDYDDNISDSDSSFDQDDLFLWMMVRENAWPDLDDLDFSEFANDFFGLFD